MDTLEGQIAQWRDSVRRSAAVGRDADELESHLREQIADLTAVGLSPDEAFLVAMRRMGGVDALSGEFAREHSERLWKQLGPADDADAGPGPGRQWRSALLLALGAAVSVQAARLLLGSTGSGPNHLARSVALLVLPFLAIYFGRRAGIAKTAALAIAAAFGAALLVVSLYPYDVGGATELLTVIHLPVALWFVVGVAYAGGDVRSPARRMDFVRFTGEWVVYYALIALGGGVLTGLTIVVLEPTGAIDPDQVALWLLLSGAAGAVLVSAWLVEWKQRVVENMAPVLTAVFTPLFAAMLLVAAVAYAATGLDAAFDRDLLGVFDALLVVVLGLVLYGWSARDPSRPPGWMDRIQLVALVSALLLDLLVLGAMLARVGDLGFTANRTAALGLNFVLLGNLGGSAYWSLRFLRGTATFHRMEHWQLSYLPVLAAWAAAVVVVVPVVFSFH